MMRPREEADCGPTRFAVGDYLGHGASGAVFAVVVANDAGEALGPGARVEARYQRGDRWYPGTVQAASGPAGVAVAYDDGDFEDAVARADVRPLAPEVALKVARRAAADDLEAEAALAAAVRARAPPRPPRSGPSSSRSPPGAGATRPPSPRRASGRRSPTCSAAAASARASGRRARRAPPGRGRHGGRPVVPRGGRAPLRRQARQLPAPGARRRRRRRRRGRRPRRAPRRGGGAARPRPRPHGLRARRRPAAPPRGNPFSTALDHAHLAAFEWPPARADRRRAARPRAPWVHEIDTYAVGVCLHLIATGAWPTRDGRRQGTPPRAWDRDFWTSLIDAHLHTDPDAGAPSFARRREFVAATRAALDARRFEDLDAELRRWCRRAAG